MYIINIYDIVRGLLHDDTLWLNEIWVTDGYKVLQCRMFGLRTHSLGLDICKRFVQTGEINHMCIFPWYNFSTS